jgi:hypothetical protein
MSTLQQQIRSSYQRNAHRPIPGRWIRQQPILSRYSSRSALVTVIRDDDRITEADGVIRALVALNQIDSEAGTALLEALAMTWPSSRRLSAEFRDEILVELALVILEAADLNDLDRLATRLTRRAHARARRRYETARTTRDRERTMPPAELIPRSEVDVAQHATDRAMLTATLETIRGHVATGRLPERAWTDFRDGRLAPAAGWRRLQADRSRTYRGRRAVMAVLGHAC